MVHKKKARFTVFLLVISMVLTVLASGSMTAEAADAMSGATALADTAEAALNDGSKKNVLFISAYNYDWPATVLQIEGLRRVLDDQVTLQYLFMNTKHIVTNRA